MGWILVSDDPGSKRALSMKPTGTTLALAYQRTESLVGISTGVYNRTDEAHGLMIGVFNHADTLHGIQIVILNHVGSGPAAARWLPLINARF